MRTRQVGWQTRMLRGVFVAGSLDLFRRLGRDAKGQLAAGLLHHAGVDGGRSTNRSSPCMELSRLSPGWSPMVGDDADHVCARGGQADRPSLSSCT